MGRSQEEIQIVKLLADRAALATFVLEHRETVKRVARRKLSRPTRAVYDSDDVLATVLRRMDKLAAEGAIRATTEAEVLTLIFKIAENSAISKRRLIELTRDRIEADGEFARSFLQRLNSCESDDDAGILVFKMYERLRGAHARQLFLLRLRGIEHRVIAQMLEITPATCRQRWATIKTHLMEGFQEELF